MIGRERAPGIDVQPDWDGSTTRVAIRPTPSAEELAAIVAALSTRIKQDEANSRADLTLPASAWVLAARRMALHSGDVRPSPDGWRLAARVRDP